MLGRRFKNKIMQTVEETKPVETKPVEKKEPKKEIQESEKITGISTTFDFGSRTITATITHKKTWQTEKMTRIYYQVKTDSKITPIDKFYLVVDGGTKDETIKKDDKIFGFTFSIDCNSHTKRDVAVEAVQDLINKIIAKKI